MRRIVTSKYQAKGGPPDVDTFFDRVVKYIPTEIVSAWVAVKGLVAAAAVQSKELILWICFGVGVILTALYMLKRTAQPGQPPAVTQTAIATGAFIVWVFALGEPFTSLLGAAQQGLIGSLLLIGYTLVAGLIIPKE